MNEGQNAAAPTKKRPASSPVPSITIQVNKKDAEQFMRASDAIAAKLVTSGSSTVPSEGTTNNPSAPLHEMLHQAASDCNDEAVSMFRSRLKSSPLTPVESKAAFLLFHQSEFDAKLKALFQAFASDAETGLPRDGLLSLFRTLLTSITCCCETERSQAVQDKPESDEPPQKKTKREDTATNDTTVGASLPQEDDQSRLTKDVEDVAGFAADQVLGFAKDKALAVTAHVMNAWYSEKGSHFAPWLELLSSSRWKEVAQQGDNKPSPTADKENREVKENREPKENRQAVSAKRQSAKTEPIDQVDFNKDTLFGEPPKVGSSEDTSKPLVSFDFSGSDHPEPLCIEISENNLYALRHFVHRTGLMHFPASAICKQLLRFATRRSSGAGTILTLSRDAWIGSISSILEGSWSLLSSVEREAFIGCFTEIFSCFEGNKPVLRSDEVDLQEFAVGFCFFCSGNKSSKLATGFEVLDDQGKNYLTEEHLRRYLTSYLTMLVAMSVLAPISNHNSTGVIANRNHREMRSAVESGAKWTLNHFLGRFGDHGRGSQSNRYSFESFATWYSSGGYEVAPWLELLDLNKVFSLIGSTIDMAPPNSLAPHNKDKMSSLRRHHSGKKGPPPEILFTFPLANHRSLIVLKDDATYVRSVVDQLGLLAMNPNELWSQLSKLVEKKKKAADSSQGTVYVSQATFLSCMDDICPTLKRNRPDHPERMQTSELLSNFFQCFDVEQRDHVAVDELMGGLTLLCGGKKSHKLAFAFGVFDTRPGIHLKKKKETITHSLSGEDLFLFLRSILIVTFSCCRQSLDMTDGMVSRCIADTANMICNDVMCHQWDLRRKDRLNFDEFGQWYNDGGFERAPWLELLDLKKWVLVEPLESLKTRQDQSLDKKAPPSPTLPPATTTSVADPDPTIPPPPPEDELDPDFFESNIMPMDSMDEMDMILMQPSTDKDLDLGSPRISQSFSHSHSPEPQLPSPSTQQPPLKFHLSTSDDHGGYSLSISHRRIAHLRSILESSSLHKMEAELVCRRILDKANSKNRKLTKESFEEAIESIIGSMHPGAREEERSLFNVLTGIFSSFERDGSKRVSAIEVACGFTVLCTGKKSDKLEFAFDVLDKRKRGQLSRDDMTNYLRSFLTVLFGIAFSPHLKDDTNWENSVTTLQGQPCDHSARTLAGVVDSAAFWATSMAFEGHIARHSTETCMSMSFDDFAEWYTTKGYSSIPWLELLDLRKWVF